MSVQDRIQKLVDDNRVLLFMKGTRNFPQCGFSMRAVNIVNTLGVPFETVDVLSDMEIRQGIKEFSSWPTIPQLYIDGQFIGGSDICWELYQNGELEKLVADHPKADA
ncbi:MAG: Grx4 family monothiol glutaredoxin [Deltaproteobacteria bacterium]|nr:MAG: Grx4 family monothiol glutaredoxin [Deltaproteobacteria bacterium]